MKKDVLRNFTKFRGKHLCQSLFFNKVPGHGSLLKKRLWHRCFPINFAKFLRIPFLRNTSGRRLLYRAHEHDKAFQCIDEQNTTDRNGRNRHRRYSVKKVFLKFFQYSRKTPLIKRLFSLKKAPTQVFCCEYCELFIKFFLYKTAQVTASAMVNSSNVTWKYIHKNCVFLGIVSFYDLDVSVSFHFFFVRTT